MDRIRGLAASADDVDDGAAAAFGHPLDDDVERMDVAEELRVHRGVPRLCVQLGRRIAPRGAGRVHEHVDRPECGLRLVDDARGLCRVDQVGGERDRAVRDAGDASERGVEVRAAARHERHLRAFAGERFGACEADALARAGDEDDLALESEIHWVTNPYLFAKRFSRLAMTAGHALWKYALFCAHSSPSP